MTDNTATVNSVDYDDYELMLQGLSNRARAAFACVCAERVFSIYESAFGVCDVDPPAMRRGLDIAWRYVEGHSLGPGDLEEAGAMAHQAIPDSEDCQDSFSVHYAGCAIGNAVIAPRVGTGAAAAAVNALDALRAYESEHPSENSKRDSQSLAMRREHEMHQRLATHLRASKDSELSSRALSQFLA
jgi:hypothetical protein